MNQTINVDQLNATLGSLRTLRSSINHVFETLSNGLRADHGEDGKDKFLLELQELLSSVNTNLRELDQITNSLPIPTAPLNLGNTTFLCQESTQVRQGLYTQLVNCYKWSDKIHEYSSIAHTLLTQNSLKRSYSSSGGAKRRGCKFQCNNNPTPMHVDGVINSLGRSYTDMKVTITRPFASNVVIQINLTHVLKAVVSFKGLLMEWVMVKAYGEPMDLWTESRHQVFRKITENAHAAMLHFYSPAVPELAVRTFMTWIHSYVNLFSDTCKRCGCHIHYTGMLPPTWRDFRTLECYHDECKQ